MNGLEQALVEKFDRDGRVAVWMGHDNLSNILSYLFAHASVVYVNGRYTVFKRALRPLFFYFRNRRLTSARTLLYVALSMPSDFRRRS